MDASTYRVLLKLPRSVRCQGKPGTREEFFAWLWKQFSAHGMVGVHEGSVLSETAAKLGLETDSWTVDSGEAPRERDWIGTQEQMEAEVYFNSLSSAEDAARILSESTDVEVLKIEEQKSQDWDAEWKASFKGAFVPPFWDVLPPWEDAVHAGRKVLRLNPGAGFGTGTHETTQLCLAALGEIAQARSQAGGTHAIATPSFRPFEGMRILDFGSGSGILAIGAALLGAQVDAVEIDPLAIENAQENSTLNAVGDRIRYMQELPAESASYDLVLANILKPVLLEFAPQLARRLLPGAPLILSGLIDQDVAPVTQAYQRLVGRAPVVRERGEWRAVLFL